MYDIIHLCKKLHMKTITNLGGTIWKTLSMRLSALIWSKALIYLCLGTGVYFSIRTRFLQVRHIKDMVKYLFGGGDSSAGSIFLSSLCNVSCRSCWYR